MMLNIKSNSARNVLTGCIYNGIRHVTICYVHIRIWSICNALKIANIFIIYIARTNMYLVVCYTKSICIILRGTLKT